MTDTTYCYSPDFVVLKNLPDIRDSSQYARYESTLAEIRMGTVSPQFITTYEGYRDLHKHIFQDIFEWAGKPRTVDISKGNSFAHWPYIDKEMEKRFNIIRKEANLFKQGEQSFINRAAEHICEINAIHPFREGNGRTQRAFLKNLALQYGYQIHLKMINKELWFEGSVESFLSCDYSSMEKCIFQAIDGSKRDADLTPHFF